MRIALALLAVLIAGAAIAAPFAVQVGEARLALDAPPGFSDVQATGSPRLLELAEALTSPSNKILVFALEDGDVRRFSLGDSLDLRRYVIVVTPKALERERVSPAAFAAFVSESLRELGAPAGGADVRRTLDAQPRGRPALLSELRKDGQVVSVLQGARLADPPGSRQPPPRYVLSTTSLMLVRGKALNLALYSIYDQDSDVDWIRATTARWLEDLQRLNNR
ncbi:MAG TPA: hypothetical protein VIV54_16185 [Burkholderiales bacterium]